MKNDFEQNDALIILKKVTLNDFIKKISLTCQNNYEINQDILINDMSMLEKSLKCDIILEDFLELVLHLNKSQPNMINKILGEINRALKKYYFFNHPFSSYFYFENKGCQIYRHENSLFNIKDELSIVFWMYPRSKCREYILLEISDNKKFQISVKVIDKTLAIYGHSSKKTFSVDSIIEIPIKR